MVYKAVPVDHNGYTTAGQLQELYHGWWFTLRLQAVYLAFAVQRLLHKVVQLYSLASYRPVPPLSYKLSIVKRRGGMGLAGHTTFNYACYYCCLAHTSVQ